MTPNRIDTPRLVLRPFEMTDAPAAFAWFGDAIVMQYTPTGPDASVEQTAERILGYRLHQSAYGFSKWLIVERQENEPIGDAGLLQMPESGEIDLGFRLAPAWWGKGVATEAARAWVHAAFADFGLPRVTAFAHPENRASLRVLEKLGFHCDGQGIVMGMPARIFSLPPEGG